MGKFSKGVQVFVCEEQVSHGKINVMGMLKACDDCWMLATGFWQVDSIVYWKNNVR